ncbi:MAG: hypothetical protein HQL68_11925 [Magnetococcales bacterium]|nr:hypothetical protein [Magnetococcales bacterium]
MDAKNSFSTVLTKRQQFWLEHFRSCKRAGNSYSDYARNHGLNSNTFNTMIRRLRRLGVVEKPSIKGEQLFKKILVQPKANNFSDVRLYFPNGVCIEFNSHFDEADLPSLLQMAAQIK